MIRMQTRSMLALVLVASGLFGCASVPTDDRSRDEVYVAPETALGSNLPRRGEKRAAETREISGDAVDELRRTINTGPVKGGGGY